MPTGYQIDHQDGLYFLTLQVVDWVDVFTRKVYRDIVIDGLRYCITHKGLQVRAYVIMSNHVHLIVNASGGNLSDVLRDFKRHTAKTILKEIQQNKQESRRAWMLERFELAATRHKRNVQYQFWTHENHAVELVSAKFIRQKCSYIHHNPVRAGWVGNPSEWQYSSASNYEDRGGLVEVILLDEMYQI